MMAARSTGKQDAPKPKKVQAPAPDLDDPSLYVNRELGLLSFQWRVLEEARYLTDIVNEQTLRLGLAPYRVVVLPTGNALAPETMELWLSSS